MGLSGDGDETERKPTFSNDVLRLEVSGPNQEHLNVIDVPGIFKITTQAVTTKADIKLLRKVVKGYMDNPRSVMFAVVLANVDVATQEILDLAVEADVPGDRTIGVLTDSGFVDRGGLWLDNAKEPTIIGQWQLDRNVASKLSLAEGGITVRNF
ncbi:hypothetical protein LTR85_001559 [Meristemomyces frigidus]|nr:hypothetical protein LTR85_001559 [Meristemomyces frigidus]